MIGEAIPLGNLVELAVAFTNALGEPENPSAVVCQVLPPTGKRETLTPSNTNVGMFTQLVTVDVPGCWHYRFAGTGGLVAAGESDFWVANSSVV